MQRHWRFSGSFRLAAVAACGVLGACGGEPFDPADLLTHSFSSEHFLYHSVPGDTVDTTWQEDYFGWLMGELSLSPPTRLTYNKYRDRDHLERVTGQATNGFAEPASFTFHSIWDRDNHEVVHALVGGLVGSGPGLLNEGLAVAHHGKVTAGPFVPDEPHWNGEPVHTIARRRRAAGQLPSLDALLESSDFFRNFTNEEVYPLAGSFARFLIDQTGADPYLAYLAIATPGDSRSETRTKFLQAFGESIDVWWDRWLVFLAQP